MNVFKLKNHHLKIITHTQRTKESKLNTKDSHDITREASKRRKKRTT